MYLKYQISEKGADKTSIFFYSILILYILSTAIIALDVATETGEVYSSHNSAGTNNNLFIRGQCISADLECQHSGFDFEYHGRLRRLYLSNYPSKHKPVNHHDTHQSFVYPNLQRYTGAGLCGIAISVSWSFLQSLRSHSLVSRPISLEWLISIYSIIALSYLDFVVHIFRWMEIVQPWSRFWVADQSIVDMSRPILDCECYGNRLNCV